MNASARLQAIVPLWPWLPAFRVVAEAEHLPSAARRLDVTPSTLSRSIAALERAVGKRLFERTGRSLRLNPDGRVLLAAVRDAMRWIEEGVVRVGGAGFRGDFVVASGGAGTTAIVAPLLAEMRRLHPELVPHIVTRASGETSRELLRGGIDVAFQESAAELPGLVCEEVGRIGRGVYCGRAHPLFGRAKVTLADVVGADFVAPPPASTGEPVDGWPIGLERVVAMVVDQLRVGVEVCASLPLLAVLPDVLAKDRGPALRRLPVDVVGPSAVYAMFRRPLGDAATPATVLLGLLRAGAE